ncbi:DUF697 domain-containing protein [Desulfobacterales bacterium HSG2]|nr:DUF697 domain-containing protein [Desulfobacterales bacterium HSG2]
MGEIETKKVKAKRAEAYGIVKNYALGALGVGIIPFPLVDMAALTGVQLKMLHRLTRLYNIEFSEHLGKSFVASLIGGGIPLSFSLTLVSLIKFTPISGQLTGMIGVALFGSASTYAIGRVFIQHFESGGTFLTFNPQEARGDYVRQFKKGKDEVRKSFAGIKP